MDRRFYEGELKMAQVVRKHYWEVALTQLWVGDTMLCCENEQDSTILREESDQNNDAQSTIEKSYVIVDSGTSFNSLPHRDYERFIKLVPSIPAASFSADKIASYPTIKYVLGDIVLKLKPTDYMVLHDGFYRAGFIQIDIPSQFGRAYILGSNIFMKRYFTVFRHAHNGNPPMVSGWTLRLGLPNPKEAGYNRWQGGVFVVYNICIQFRNEYNMENRITESNPIGLYVRPYNSPFIIVRPTERGVI